MDERELRLNSLSQYSKVSPHFVLEEHGHCEVPAGCGGVVLRWRNPGSGTPFSMRLFSPGDCSLFLDGTPPVSSRPVLPFGEHVLAFAISGFDEEYAVLLFDGTARQDDTHLRISSAWPGATQAAEISVRSAADGSWRYTWTEPDDDLWMYPGFDDGDWPAMKLRDVPPVPERQEYRLDTLTRTGAGSLGVQGTGSRVWVRKVFQISDQSGPTAPDATGGDA